MLMDFERFKRTAAVAYRRIEPNGLTLDDAITIFREYFEVYEAVVGDAHPMIAVEQVRRIMEAMPFIVVCYEDEKEIVDLDVDDYQAIIDQHFAANYYEACDFNINHFFSGQIRANRFHEVCRN